MKNTFAKLLLVLLVLPICFAVKANPYLLTNNDTEPSYVPHIYLGGYGGISVLGEADILAPILPKTTYNNLFVYGQGRYSYDKRTWTKNPWTGSLGLGYRQIVANTVLLGFYALGDYVKTITDRYLKQISPGVEILSRTLDFRANGYFPLSEKYCKYDCWADDINDYSHVRYYCHSQYDYRYLFCEEIGDGGDAELGCKLFKVKNTLVKGFINGYYFGMKHNDSIIGGGAKITIQPNTYLEISLADSYDNYNHNVFMAGVRVSIYDLLATNKLLDDRNLQRRLFEPIDRNFASLGSASSVRMAAPSEPKLIKATEPERDNLWFFDGSLVSSSSNANGGDGTYENPYHVYQYNQATIDFINAETAASNFSSAYLYFSPGTFNSYTAGSPYVPINLYSTETMWGRMNGPKGFLEPATGTNRALFIGSLQLATDVSLNDLRIENNFLETDFTTGVIINNSTNIAINNVVVGVANDADTGYATGIDMNNSNATLSDSDVFGYSETGDAYGLYDTNSGDIELNNITNCTFEGVSTANNGYGFHVESTSGNVTLGNIVSSTFSGDGGNGTDDKGCGLDVASPSGNITLGTISNFSTFTGKGRNSYGLCAISDSALTLGDISQSNFCACGVVNSVGSGVYVKSDSGNIDIKDISNSSFTGNTGSGGFDIGYGFYVESNSGNINIDNISNSSTFIGLAGTGNYDEGYGFHVESNSGNIDIENILNSSTFTGDAGPGNYDESYGFYAESITGKIEITNISNSSFNGNAGVGKSDKGYSFYIENGAGDIVIGSISNSSAFRGDAGVGNDDESYGLYAKNAFGKIDIASISSSTFIGNAGVGKSDKGYGFYIENGAGDIVIGSISNSSTFRGDAEGSKSDEGYGFYATNTSGNINVASISNSSFAGDGDTTGIAFYANAVTTIIGPVAGDVTNNSFTGSTIGIDLYGSSILINGDTVLGTAYTNLKDPTGANNTFAVSTGNHLGFNSSYV